MPDLTDRLRFDPVMAEGQHAHCYLDNYYVARISLHGDHCNVDGAGFAACQVPNEEEAREVVRMWVDWHGVHTSADSRGR